MLPLRLKSNDLISSSRAVVSTLHCSKHKGAGLVQLTESVVHPVGHCYPGETAAQPVVQPGNTVFLDRPRQSLGDGQVLFLRLHRRPSREVDQWAKAPSAVPCPTVEAQSQVTD